MMANLAASLFAAEGITTTEAKAKALRPDRREAHHQGQEGAGPAHRTARSRPTSATRR
jgi:ribosomal protein L17